MDETLRCADELNLALNSERRCSGRGDLLPAHLDVDDPRDRKLARSTQFTMDSAISLIVLIPFSQVARLRNGSLHAITCSRKSVEPTEESG